MPRASKRPVRRKKAQWGPSVTDEPAPVTTSTMTDEDYLTYFGKPRSFYHPTGEEGGDSD